MIQSDLFARFASAYHVEDATGCAPDDVRSLFPTEADGLREFVARYAGASFNQGVYRAHDLPSIPRWNQIVGEAFPDFAPRIHCFASDWLGRQFAIDDARQSHGQPLLLMLEPASGLVLSRFDEWRAATGEILSATACVGFNVPLFLGGSDDLSNLEFTDGEIYWSVCGQLWNHVRQLPPGTRIGSVKFTA